MKHVFVSATTILTLILALSTRADDAAPELPNLEEELLKEGAAALAKAAREQGDPTRGAIVFYQQHLTCTKCHTFGEENLPLGPDLTRPTNKDKVTDTLLVESVLQPSKEILEGYETIVVVNKDGLPIAGLLAEDRPDALVIRDPAKDGKLVTIAKDEIEERSNNTNSVMPKGLVNQLANRQKFLDLMRYVMEITEKGPERAKELEPAPSLYALTLPEYEDHIDHASMIADLNNESFQRGEAIYHRLCVNCHGTLDLPGSLPTSLRFAADKFRNGSDPNSMYNTLSRGFGMMAPQTWMVPQQKYDVIHYIRETYLAKHNPTQYTKVDEKYLAGLPAGDTRGPAPSKFEPWVAIHPRIAGQLHYENNTGPGWSQPKTGAFEDPRFRGRDNRPYGPLPREWAHYQGLYHYGHRVIVAYTVGNTGVLEMPAVDASSEPVMFQRILDIGPRRTNMILQVAQEAGSSAGLHVWDDEKLSGRIAVIGEYGSPHTDEPAADGGSGGVVLAGISQQIPGADWLATPDGSLRLKIPVGNSPLRFTLSVARARAVNQVEPLIERLASDESATDLSAFTSGGPARWPGTISTQPVMGKDDDPFAVDVLTHPTDNPWFCRMRLTGFDFMPDPRRAAVSSWDGSVWMVSGLNIPEEGLTWQRIASGLFQPLGLKVVDGKIYVSCRDQIAILHDLNGDGETDFYENFNNDHQVTEHFHEFAMGLQRDDQGNFYYAKSARHALPALVEHHGTLLRVSKDGLRTDILAKGFRAANGVCLNPDGTFFVTDQEGHWMPKNRINWVPGHGGFYGNMLGYHDVTDSSDDAMLPPLCWITNRYDRSPAELLWVSSDQWGLPRGTLLNTSYGYGMVYVVPHEKVAGQLQGGVSRLPIHPFPTGVMRGRFHPDDGQLYLAGMFSWASSVTQPGGFYRLRYTGQPVYLPIGLQAKRSGLTITFPGTLDRESAETAANYSVQVWEIKRAAMYGSDHYNERWLEVKAAMLSQEGKTVTLAVPDIQPTWCMEIRYRIKGEDGRTIDSMIHNTIHNLGN